MKHTLLLLCPTYLPFLIPHGERLAEEHRGSLWARKLSCGFHVAPVVILSTCVRATVVKALKKNVSSVLRVHLLKDNMNDCSFGLFC